MTSICSPSTLIIIPPQVNLGPRLSAATRQVSTPMATTANPVACLFQGWGLPSTLGSYVCGLQPCPSVRSEADAKDLRVMFNPPLLQHSARSYSAKPLVLRFSQEPRIFDLRRRFLT